MKGIYLNLPDDVYAKVEEIASEKGRLTKTAAIRLMIMEYGQVVAKTKVKKQTAKPEKPKKNQEQEPVNIWDTDPKDWTDCPDCKIPLITDKNDSRIRYCEKCGIKLIVEE